MDLVFNKSSADASFRHFAELARQIFHRQAMPMQAIKVLAWVANLRSFLADGKYNDHALEETLMTALGPDRQIFDVGTTPGVGSRVAIITSRISDGKACVLANYRGIGRHAQPAAYEFLLPRNQDHNAFLWEV